MAHQDSGTGTAGGGTGTGGGAGAAAGGPAPSKRPRRLTARMKLTLTYALFVFVAGAFSLVVVYLALRFVPNYPLGDVNPQAAAVATRPDILQALVKASGVVLLFLALLGLGAGWLIAGRVLRPLQDITRAARRAADGSLDHRIGLTGPRDEFTELSDTFDDMLARLQRSFEAQQRFAANASHELRTPLAVSRTMLDVAVADPDGQDYRRLVSRLRETNQRGIDITDALLQLSALDHTPPATEEGLDLADTARGAVETVREEAETRGVTLSAGIHPAPVTGNGVLLRQLVLNLLHNAVRHNLPTGGSLALTVGPDPVRPGRALLTVTNTGPLLPDTVDHLTEPFLRGGGRLAEKDPTRRGHGLGLTIVSSIVRAHHGELTLTPNSGGGLTVRVSLPGPGQDGARPSR
ncbi:HAMP domain-containing sensor histidine kinase [Streptomyces sp. ML-6]|uniref:sensor histidine kinase n=1 Tax=Streptomyces sp. ML-6 TaxID=2982693 RepID=UPI0024BF7422|nr:HAMP domain-containing sensor histidine kinase [Streptomyces sp. ML-6]MDK0520114.1 HAMP domain-containing histidine kinase [Streptomyces sp. ML-6]